MYVCTCMYAHIYVYAYVNVSFKLYMCRKMSSLLLWKFPTVGIHSFGNQSTQNVFLKIIVLRMSLVLLFYPFRPYSGNASFLFCESAHLTFLEAVTEGKWSHVWQNWGWWKVWHQCFTTLELLQTRDLILLKFWIIVKKCG